MIGCVRRILERNRDLNAKSEPHGLTALHYAALRKESEIIKLLINAGADVNIKTNNTITALHNAAVNGCHIENVKEEFV